MSRRVLLLTYYFPPSGGPGVQRMLKCTKYLPACGWQPDVLTVRAGAYPERDATLGEEVPPDVGVHRTSTLEPFAWYQRLVGSSEEEDGAIVGSVQEHQSSWIEQLALWIRANVFLPDARVGWVPFAVAKGRRLLSDGAFDAVLTSGPPHSVHLAGWALHRLTGVPWVADLRDPWTDINYYEELPHTSWARRLDRSLERGVLQGASAVTTVSPAWKKLLHRKVASEKTNRFHVVQNGYDAADFAASPAPSSDAFVLSYVGSLYASRNPEALWKALQRLQAKDAVPRLHVRLVGSVDAQVRAAIARHGLAERVEHVPYVPHQEAVRHMQTSALLLLVVEDFPAAEGMMTGKLYEYLASGRPVLGIGPAQGDAASLLEKTDAGRMFDRADVEGVARLVQAHYAAWAEGAPKAGARPDDVQPYSREAQTRRLASVLEEVCSTP